MTSGLGRTYTYTSYNMPSRIVGSRTCGGTSYQYDYTYTLAAQSVSSGLPITRPLYLDYPDQSPAYTNPNEYLYGPDVLVAPVTTPGAVSSPSTTPSSLSLRALGSTRLSSEPTVWL